MDKMTSEEALIFCMHVAETFLVPLEFELCTRTGHADATAHSPSICAIASRRFRLGDALYFVLPFYCIGVCVDRDAAVRQSVFFRLCSKRYSKMRHFDAGESQTLDWA